MSYREKLKHAYAHLMTFQESVQAFLDDDPYEEVRKYEPHPDPLVRVVVIGYKKRRELPADLPFIAGDIIYNMRSALDHLAYSLCVAHVGAEKIKEGVSMFPIHAAIGSYMDAGVRACRQMSDEAKGLIQQMQPYHGPKPHDRQRHPLAVLNALSNIDKHRHLILKGMVSARTSLGIQAMMDVDMEASVGGAVLGPFQDQTDVIRLTLRVAGPKPDVKMKADFVIDPTFPDPGPAAGEIVTAELGRIFKHIDQEVFGPLEKLL